LQAPALQAPSPEFKHQSHQRKKDRKKERSKERKIRKELMQKCI
jgi:hypothetical protein